MSWLLENTLVTALAAGTLLLAHRWCKPRPALAHVLWLLVLLKLLCPPALRLDLPFAAPELWDTAVAKEPQTPLSVRLVPRSDAAPAAAAERGLRLEVAGGGEALFVPRTTAIATPVSVPQEPSFLVTVVRAAADWGITQWLFVLWIAGSLGMLGCWSIGMLRLRRTRRQAAAPAAWLQRELERTATQLGVRAPRMFVSPRIGSAFVYGLARPVLMWPSRGTNAQDLARIRSVLAHELAHIRRRDHWIAWLEVFATAALWWHPLLWLARSQMRLQAELACDAWAVWSAPQARHSYAGALIDAVAQESQAVTAVPVLAARPGARRAFETRLNMILNHDVPCRLSAWTLAPVAALSLTVLSGFSFAQEKESDKKGDRSVRAEMLRAVNQELRSRLGKKYQVKSLEDLNQVVDRYVRDQTGKAGDHNPLKKLLERRATAKSEGKRGDKNRDVRIVIRGDAEGSNLEEILGDLDEMRIEVNGKVIKDLDNLRVELNGEAKKGLKELKSLNLSKMLGGLLGEADVDVDVLRGEKDLLKRLKKNGEVKVLELEGLMGKARLKQLKKELKGVEVGAKGILGEMLKGADVEVEVGAKGILGEMLKGADVEVDSILKQVEEALSKELKGADVEIESILGEVKKALSKELGGVKEVRSLRFLNDLKELKNLKELEGLKFLKDLDGARSVEIRKGPGGLQSVQILKDGEVHVIKGDDGNVFEIHRHGQEGNGKNVFIRRNNSRRGDDQNRTKSSKRIRIQQNSRSTNDQGEVEDIRLQIKRIGEQVDGNIEHSLGGRTIRVEHKGNLKNLESSIRKAIKEAKIGSESDASKIKEAIQKALREAGLNAEKSERSGERTLKTRKEIRKKLRKIAANDSSIRRV